MACRKTQLLIRLQNELTLRKTDDAIINGTRMVNTVITLMGLNLEISIILALNRFLASKVLLLTTLNLKYKSKREKNPFALP